MNCVLQKYKCSFSKSEPWNLVQRTGFFFFKDKSVGGGRKFEPQDEGKDRSNAFITQEPQGASAMLEARQCQEGVAPLSHKQVHSPADSSNPDSGPPGLRKNRCLLFVT